MKVFIFFALFCLAVASASVIGPLGPLGLGSVAVAAPLGTPLAGSVVVGGHGLIAPGHLGLGGVRIIG